MEQPVTSQSSDIQEENALQKKRPRPVLSCIECRRKKLKCNRLLPCDQCKKSGRTAQCAFTTRHEPTASGDEGGNNHGPIKRTRVEPVRDEEGQNSIVTLPVVNDNSGIIEDLQARVEKLENLLSGETRFPIRGMHVPIQDASPADVLTHQPRNGVPGMLILNRGRSRYHAPDQKLPMFAKFEQPMQFVLKMFSKPDMRAMRKDMKAARQAILKKTEPVIVLPSNTSDLVRIMKTELPPRDVCDRLVAIYFDNFETIIRILHKPTFLRDYAALWKVETTSDSKTQADIIPQLLAVSTIAATLMEGELWYTAAKDPTSSEAICHVLKAWIDSLTSKGRMKLSTLQTQCLLLIAQQVYPLQYELLGNDSAALVRSAMAMGLHRDPSEFPNLSIFQGELRRRLWMTIVELDLHLCQSCGGLPMVRHGDFSTSPAATVNDEDLFENMTKAPVSIPSLQSTHKHFYAALSGTLRRRLDSSEGSNNYHQLTYAKEAKKQRSLLEAIKDETKKFSHSVSMAASLAHLFNFMLLQVHIQRTVLSIYRIHAFEVEQQDNVREMEESSLEASLHVLSYLRRLDPVSTDLDGDSSLYFDLFHILCKYDILQAALTVCLALRSMNQKPQHNNAYVRSNGTIWWRASLIQDVELTLDSLLRRKFDISHDIRDILCLAVVLESVRTTGSTESKEEKMREAVLRIINVYNQSLVAFADHASKHDGSPLHHSEIVPGLDQNNTALLDNITPVDGIPILLDSDLSVSEPSYDLNEFLDFGFPNDWDWQYSR